MPPLTRRDFLLSSAAAAIARHRALSPALGRWSHPWTELASLERPRVLHAAKKYLREQPRTIASIRASRSAGGPHDFYSEGDYWWPDPTRPNGPYIRRDGKSNPENFVAHRELLLRFSIQMPALTAAWLLTKDRAFAQHAVRHLRAWFIEPVTRMNPNLEFAQAIHGRNTGRSIGIIDTVHLVEVAQAALVLEQMGEMTAADLAGVHAWFNAYLEWLTTSSRGIQERDQKNNHGSCWLLQVAEFATLIGDQSTRSTCRSHFETVLIPNQIAADGSFPLELARTKPYSYSLFNLDILGMSAQVLSDQKSDLWSYSLPDGRGLDLAFRFMVPYIRNKSRWPYKQDVEYFNDLPVRQPSLLFAGLAYRRPDYLSVWQQLNPDPAVPEVIRNHPIRQPLLWIRH